MKKGYFFTLDAFLAIGILSVGLIMLYLSQSFAPSTVQAEFLAQDLLQTLGSTKLSIVNNNFIDDHRIAGNITNMDNTILEQLGEFYFTNSIGNAQNFTLNITHNIVAARYHYLISLDQTVLYNDSILHDNITDLSVAKNMVLGTINTSVLWGPYDVEVLVWR